MLNEDFTVWGTIGVSKDQNTAAIRVEVLGLHCMYCATDLMLAVSNFITEHLQKEEICEPVLQ